MAKVTYKRVGELIWLSRAYISYTGMWIVLFFSYLTYFTETNPKKKKKKCILV